MLKNIIENIKNKKVYIQTHNFPDPDAVACAYGLQQLLLNEGIQAVICYKGDIKRTNTYKMTRILNIEMIEMSDLNEISSDSEVILVDAQRGNANIFNMVAKEIICIDHHPIYENIDYLYSDIRPEIGACASIIASYYYDNNIPIPASVATALLYGLKVDTANMTRGVSKLDLDMFYNLYQEADNIIISELDTGVIDFEDLKTYARAISGLHTAGDICFSNIGNNCPEALIATICDFMLELDGIGLAVIYSIREDGIKFSVRSDGSYHAGIITNEALGGIGNGGGHEKMAGGFVPYENINRSEEADKMHARIENRFVIQAEKYMQTRNVSAQTY